MDVEVMGVENRDEHVFVEREIENREKPKIFSYGYNKKI